MASIVKNLDTIISKAVNGPKVDGIPLYTRLDGTQELNGVAKVKSEKWEAVSKHTYSSPTNIRRLFITGNRVLIETYKPVIVNNKPDGRGCWREIKIQEDNIMEIAKKLVTYRNDIQKYYQSKQMGVEATQPDKITIKGTGLGVLSSPWVLSNIEEVYFDWTLLVGESNRNKISECEKVLNAYVSGKRGYVKSNVPLEMFIGANSCNIKNMRTRFPRLKCVGLISELDKVLQVGIYKGNQNIDSLEASARMWLEEPTNIEIVKKSNSLMMICKVNSDLPHYNTNFSLRDGIYKYDQEVLSKFFEEYAQRVKNKARENQASRQKQDEVKQEEVVNTTKSELEELLDSMEGECSQADIKSVLYITVSGCKKSEVDELFNSMTPEGAKKYRAMLK